MTMAPPKISERSSLQGTRNTFSLPYIPQFMEPDVKDTLEFPDLDTLSLLLGIKRSDAEKVVIRNNENVAGYRVRGVAPPLSWLSCTRYASLVYLSAGPPVTLLKPPHWG